MFRWFHWFRRRKEIPRLGGRTATEWYHLHREPQYRDATWALSLEEAVRQITTSADGGSEPVRLTDVLVTDASEVARCVAAIQLRLDQPAVAEQSLIAALQDDSEIVRRIVAVSLLEIGSVRGLAAVIAGSRHGHAVRTHATQKIAKMTSGEAADAVPALMVLLQYRDINWRTHHNAVAALRTIGDAAIPSLVNGLRRGTEQMRQYCAIALDEIGKTPELSPLIEEELRRAGLSNEEDDEATPDKSQGHASDLD